MGLESHFGVDRSWPQQNWLRLLLHCPYFSQGGSYGGYSYNLGYNHGYDLYNMGYDLDI